MCEHERKRLVNWARVLDGWVERAKSEARYGYAAVLHRQAVDARREAAQPDLGVEDE